MNFCSNVLKRKLHTVCCIYNVGFVETSFPMDFVERRISAIFHRKDREMDCQRWQRSIVQGRLFSCPSIFMPVYFQGSPFYGRLFSELIFKSLFQGQSISRTIRVYEASLLSRLYFDLPCNPK